MPKWTDKPWERQKGESEKAFEAFVTYRDMGEKRTLTAVAEKLQKSGTLIRRWKSTWDWAERVRAYDNELEKEAHTKLRDFSQNRQASENQFCNGVCPQSPCNGIPCHR